MGIIKVFFGNRGLVFLFLNNVKIVLMNVWFSTGFSNKVGSSLNIGEKYFDR